MKLPASESGRPDSLRLAGISTCNEEMHESRELYRKGADDRSSYFVAVGIEKLLSFLLPISERIEWMCIVLLGLEGKVRETLESRSIERYMTQIMKGVSEALNELINNENQIPFLYPTEVRLFDQCMNHGGILMKNAFLYRICEMAKKEAISKWNSYTKDFLLWVQNYDKEPRYCGILGPVRILPSLTDRLLEAKTICSVIENRLISALDNQGPVQNAIRTVHLELSGATDSAEKEEISDDGFGMLVSVATKIREKIGTIASNGPKYTDLILMENLWFLHTTMEMRSGAQMESFLEKWNSDFLAVGNNRGMRRRHKNDMWSSKSATSLENSWSLWRTRDKLSTQDRLTICVSPCTNQHSQRVLRWGTSRDLSQRCENVLRSTSAAKVDCWSSAGVRSPRRWWE